MAVDQACGLIDSGAQVKGIEGDGNLIGLTGADILVIHARRQAKQSNGHAV